MGAFLFRSGFAHADNVITKRCSKTITCLLLSRLPGNKPHSPEPSGTFRKLHPEPTPAHIGTLRNLPEPASRTYTSTHRNPPKPDSGTYTSTHRNPPEPASGTFRTLLPEPTPTTHRCWGIMLVSKNESVYSNRKNTTKMNVNTACDLFSRKRC